MNRRAALRFAGLSGLTLAGCTAAQVASTLATLAAGWATLPGDLSAAGINIPTAITSQVTTTLADLQSKASQIGTAVGAPPTTVSGIVSDISLVASLLSPFFPQATPIGDLLEAGVSLIGTLLTEAGVTGAAAAAPKPKMAPASALAILRAAAGK